MEDLKRCRLTTFVSHRFNQDKHSYILNEIFNKIVNTFPSEYNLITSYKNSTHYSSHPYYKLLFQQPDLVHYIFQHLSNTTTQPNIINCSLVDSIWLYHSFDPKCLRYIGKDNKFNLFKLRGINTRHIWQRLSLIEEIFIQGFDDDKYYYLTQSLVDGLKQIRFGNVKTTHIAIPVSVYDNNSINLYNQFVDMLCSHDKQASIMTKLHLRVIFTDFGIRINVSSMRESLRPASEKHQRKIVVCDAKNCKSIKVTIVHNVSDDNSVIRFNCDMNLLTFSTSNKCKQLTLCGKITINSFDHDWSGIKTLFLKNVDFDFIDIDCDSKNNDNINITSNINSSINKKSNSNINNIKRLDSKSKSTSTSTWTNAMKALAQQCRNIQQITFRQPTNDMLTFWKYINNYLIKNNSIVTLLLNDGDNDEETVESTSTGCSATHDKVIKTICQNNYKIDELIFDPIYNSDLLRFIQTKIFTNDIIKNSIEKITFRFANLIFSTYWNFGIYLQSLDMDFSKLSKLKKIIIDVDNYCVTRLSPVVNLLYNIYKINQTRDKNNLISIETTCLAKIGVNHPQLGDSGALQSHNTWEVNMAKDTLLPVDNIVGLYKQLDRVFDSTLFLMDQGTLLKVKIDFKFYVEKNKFYQLLMKIKKDKFEPFCIRREKVVLNSRCGGLKIKPDKCEFNVVCERDEKTREIDKLRLVLEISSTSSTR